MKHRTIIATFESKLHAAWQSQLASAQSVVLPAERQALFQRFARHYRQLCTLPRRVRRALQRQWKRSLPGLALLLALGQAPALGATITVTTNVPDINDGDGFCSLIEAIENAEADAQTYVDCDPGSEADTLELPPNSTHTLTVAYGSAGLPTVSSAITIEGHGSTIARDGSAPGFGIFDVNSTGNLTLRETTVSGGGG